MTAPPAPVIVIVGRPNVGKSTLFNRLIGRRRAIVGDEPGITRDRLYGDAEWRGRRLRVVDTGGIIPEETELIPAAIYEQAKIAMKEAEAVILVVDARSELAAPDLELARLLHRSGKPLFLAVNKIDTPKLEMYAEEFHRLGIRQLFPISAENGTGVAELLEAVIAVLPAVPEEAEAKVEAEDSGSESPSGNEQEIGALEAEPSVDALSGEIKVAIIGKPNVGKSTLLNALAGEGRAIVSPIPGTTRDAVDELVVRDGLRFRFIDTAGIRRKGKTNLMAEKLSVVMARKHLEAADIALLVIDASEGVSALDATIAGYAHESGRSLIIVINKWDLVLRRSQEAQRDPTSSAKSTVRQRTRAALNAGHDAFRGSSSRNSAQPADRQSYEQQVRESLKFLEYAPMVFVSAASGKNTDKIFPEVELVARERRKRVTTGEMNRFLKAIDFDRASVPSSRRVRIYYMTQAVTSPPTFILFTDRKVKLHFAYQRFIENQIRHRFGFIGSPIWIKTRQSE